VNIRGMIDRFNAITKWIVHCIVTPNKIRNRVKRYRFVCFLSFVFWLLFWCA
jgi:hypothetical protein